MGDERDNAKTGAPHQFTTPSTPLTILLVDDSQSFRAALLRRLRQEPGLEVIGEAADGAEGLERIDELLPDLVLLDLSMPNVTGLVVLKVLAAKHPQVKAIVLASDTSPPVRRRCEQFGALHVVNKADTEEELLPLLRTIAYQRASHDFTPEL